MESLNLSGIRRDVVIRAIMTVILGLNVLLGYLGYRLIPLNTTELGQAVDAVIVLVTAVVWIWGWWKNNSLTTNAQIADAILEELNEKEEVDL